MAFVRREVKKDSAYLFAAVFGGLSILLLLYTVVFSSTDTAALSSALVLPLAARYLNTGPSQAAPSPALNAKAK